MEYTFLQGHFYSNIRGFVQERNKFIIYLIGQKIPKNLRFTSKILLIIINLHIRLQKNIIYKETT